VGKHDELRRVKPPVGVHYVIERALIALSLAIESLLGTLRPILVYVDEFVTGILYIVTENARNGRAILLCKYLVAK